MKKKESLYQSPQIKVSKIRLNLFYSNFSLLGDEGTLLASCSCGTGNCGCVCPQPGCGDDCSC